MSAPKRSEQFIKTGHAPGHIRQCLLDAIDAREDWWQNLEMDFNRDRHQRWWDRASPQTRAYWLVGQLWHCRDIVPSLERHSVMDWLSNEELFSYAELARALKADLDARSRELEAEEESVASSGWIRGYLIPR